MQIDDMNIEFHATCESDRLSLHGGPTMTTDALNLCGTMYSGDWMLTSANQLHANFSSYHWNEGRGFLMFIKGDEAFSLTKLSSQIHRSIFQIFIHLSFEIIETGTWLISCHVHRNEGRIGVRFIEYIY